jgi:hypothetical protein
VAQITHFHFHFHFHFGLFSFSLQLQILTAPDGSTTDNMSMDHHEMEDEEMDEEGQMSSLAWRGMNLREQIKGTSDMS